jgi:hypothetical protein
VQLGVWASAAAFLLSQLTSCGSGGGNLADGGIGGTGVIAAGAVTAKGSIFVNGIEYSVEGAAFERDGVSQTLAEDEQSTRIGMVLEVEGTLAADGQTGRATNLRFKDLVEGTIDSSLSNSTGIKLLTILAQPVVVADGLTSFAGDLNFATIEDESGFLEVSGFRRPDGRIQASYIERKADGRFEVTGAVTAIAADGLTFRIGELTVTDSGLPPLPDDLDGALVRAEGAFYAPVSRTLDATSISLQDPGLSRADADRAEVEGFVANDFFSDGVGIPADTIFRVDGQDVVYTTATEFVRGSAEDLINNTKVEAEGPLLGGVLSAEKIEFKENLKFQGPVTAVTANSLTLTYPDALAGTSAVVVSVDPAVTEEDTRFADVSANDSVKLEGQLLGDGTALATRLRELEPANGRIILQAPVESFDEATGLLSLRGVTIDASGLSFSDDDLEMTRAEFFAALQIGSLVKAQGDQPERWDSLELER